MKKLLLIIVLALTAFASRADEIRNGIMLRDAHFTSPWSASVEKGQEVYFKSVGNGKVQIYCESEFMSPAIPESWVKMGLYKGMLTDPVANYVNVRQGPGGSYPVVRTLETDNTITYDKTDSDWYKVYWDGECIGYVHKSRIEPGLP